LFLADRPTDGQTDMAKLVASFSNINPLNAELNPIYHFLALLGAHPILHISGVRVKNAPRYCEKMKAVCMEL